MNEQKTEQKKEEAPAQPAAAETAVGREAKPPAPPTKTILGRKVGMTQIYDTRGQFIPVTVLEAGPCPILQVKTRNSDGYDALQIGFGEAKAKNVNKPLSGHFAKAGVKPLRWVREVRVVKADGFQPGQEIRVGNFAEGDLVDVSGVSKGKGFAGAMKRHRFSGLPASHGASDKERSPGSSGRERVWPGKRGPGHMGAEWITTMRLQVVKVDVDQNLLLVHGAVPGPNGGCLTIRQTARPKKARKVPPKAAAPAKKAAPKPPAKAEKK